MFTMQYSDIMETIKSMKYEDKLELKEVLNHYLIEERRERIFKNYQKSKKEVSSGQVKYYKSAQELREAIEND